MTVFIHENKIRVPPLNHALSGGTLRFTLSERTEALCRRFYWQSDTFCVIACIGWFYKPDWTIPDYRESTLGAVSSSSSIETISWSTVMFNASQICSNVRI